MTASQAKKRLKISDFKLKSLCDSGQIKRTLINSKHYDYCDSSVNSFYMKLYHQAVNARKRVDDPMYKRKKAGRKPLLEKIGRIGPNVIKVVAKNTPEYNISTKKNTPMLKRVRTGKELFTEKAFLEVHEGYDFLRNFGIVRNYIEVRYDINVNTLQTLLFLYPLQYFTAKDYREFPHKGTCRSPINTEGKPNELIEIVVKSVSRANHIFTLKKKYKKIVIEFYKLIAGVKPIPVNLKLKAKVNFDKVDAISDLAKYLASSTTHGEPR